MKGTINPAAPMRTASHPDFPEVGLTKAGRGKNRERYRRGDRREDREIEREHMRRRGDGAELNERRNEQRDHDDVGGGGRHPHAEDDTGDRGEQERKGQQSPAPALPRTG